MWKKRAELKTPSEEGMQRFLECVSSDFKQHVRRSNIILDALQELNSRVSGNEGKNKEHFKVEFCNHAPLQRTFKWGGAR